MAKRTRTSPRPKPDRKPRTIHSSREPGGGRSAMEARLIEAAHEAARFSKMRRDHKGETAEDYVELIAQLTLQSGEARTVELAKRLGVSHVTVTKTIRRLVREGLVRTEPYRSIFLTDLGRQLAQRTSDRHELVVSFLRKLGVASADAELDAEGIEHHVSDTTLAAMRRFLVLG